VWFHDEAAQDAPDRGASRSATTGEGGAARQAHRDVPQGKSSDRPQAAAYLSAAAQAPPAAGSVGTALGCRSLISESNDKRCTQPQGCVRRLSLALRGRLPNAGALPCLASRQQFSAWTDGSIKLA